VNETTTGIIREALLQALEYAMDVYQRNRSTEAEMSMSLSTAHDQGRIDGLREAIEIVERYRK
jgi:hypothetical protein